MWCNFGGPQMFIGGMGISWIFVIIFWALVIWAIIAIIRAITGSADRYDRYGRYDRDDYYRRNEYDRGSHPRNRDDEALRVLRDRYARGEIDRQEYEARRRDLMG